MEQLFAAGKATSLDTECIDEGVASYAEVWSELVDLAPELLADEVSFDQVAHDAWFEVRYGEQRFRLELEIRTDWLDEAFWAFAQRLLRHRGERSLYLDSGGGQEVGLAILTDEEAEGHELHRVKAGSEVVREGATYVVDRPPVTEDLADTLAARLDLSKKEAGAWLKTAIGALLEQLRDGKVSVAGFGTLLVRQRRGITPDGRRGFVPELGFREGAGLKEALNGGDPGEVSLLRGEVDLALVEVIRDQLLAHDVARVKGLGTFSVKLDRAATGINPATGERITIPARKRVQFKGTKAALNALTG